MNENLGILLIFENISIFAIAQQKDMESAGDGWRYELGKYFRSVENLTENALFLIKRDRIRNNLPFDGSFKKYFLDRTNFR